MRAQRSRLSAARRLAALLLSCLLLPACAAPSSTLPPSPDPALPIVRDGYFDLTLTRLWVGPGGEVQAWARAVYTGGCPAYHEVPQGHTFAHARHAGEGLFEFVLLDADRSVSSDGYGRYTDEAYTTFFRPGYTVSGAVSLPRNSRQGLPPGDYWVRVTLSYTLADDPALPLWQQPRYALALDVPFTVPGR